jgi:CRISPR-associated protein Cmr2
MTQQQNYLVSVAIGPVQDFIAQARRSRDLWFGSHVLSELSRAAAYAMSEAGATLVFPSLSTSASEFAPCDTILRAETGQPPMAVSNKILATCSDEAHGVACVEAARSSMAQLWVKIAKEARRRGEGLLGSQIDAVWNEQVGSLLEFYAAGILVRENEWADANAALDRKLAARKNVRDFRQSQAHREGAPKSSFDGGRVSVLRESVNRARGPAFDRFRVANQEQLDAVGVIKRTGGQPDQFVPVTNVALAYSLHQLTQHPETGTHFAAQLRELADAIDRSDQAEFFGRVRRPDLPCGRVFTSDAQVLLPERFEVMLTELELTEEQKSALPYTTQVRALREKTSAHPYIACLVADGDAMGRALRLPTVASPDGWRQFSSKLAEFATEARRVVEQECFGSLLYAGGDDVVAFVPVALAVKCAALLSARFCGLMQPGSALPEGTTPGDVPTLSVGIGIGHVLSGMGTLLELGRAAERDAKGSTLAVERRRDALAVIVDKRSGGQTRWRSRWSEGSGPLAQVDAALGRIGGRDGAAVESSRLPNTKMSDLERMLDRMPEPHQLPEAGRAQWSTILVNETMRILSKSERGMNRDNDTPSAEPVAAAASSQQANAHSDRGHAGWGLGMGTEHEYAHNYRALKSWLALHSIAVELYRGGARSNGRQL